MIINEVNVRGERGVQSMEYLESVFTVNLLADFGDSSMERMIACKTYKIVD